MLTNSCDEIHHFLECPKYYFLIKVFAVLIKVLQKGKVSKTLTFVVTEAEKFILKATELKKTTEGSLKFTQRALKLENQGPGSWR